MSETKKEIQAIYDRLQVEKDNIVAQTAPLRAEYENIYKEIHPLELKAADISRQIKAIEQPRLSQVSQEISGLSRLLGSKMLSDGGA